MEPTAYDIYQNDNSDFAFEKIDKSYELFHPDDHLDGKTVIHLFNDPDEADKFEQDLEKSAQAEHMTWQTELEPPDGKFVVITVDYETDHPGREILEVKHYEE